MSRRRLTRLCALAALILLSCGAKAIDYVDLVDVGAQRADSGGTPADSGGPQPVAGSSGRADTGGFGGQTSASQGGATNHGGEAGEPAAAGTGGAGSECGTALDCPAPANPCVYPTCTDGICGSAAVFAGDRKSVV